MRTHRWHWIGRFQWLHFVWFRALSIQFMCIRAKTKIDDRKLNWAHIVSFASRIFRRKCVIEAKTKINNRRAVKIQFRFIENICWWFCCSIISSKTIKSTGKTQAKRTRSDSNLLLFFALFLSYDSHVKFRFRMLKTVESMTIFLIECKAVWERIERWDEISLSLSSSLLLLF